MTFYARYMLDMEEAHKRANDHSLDGLLDEAAAGLVFYAVINLIVIVAFVVLGLVLAGAGA